LINRILQQDRVKGHLNGLTRRIATEGIRNLLTTELAAVLAIVLVVEVDTISSRSHDIVMLLVFITNFIENFIRQLLTSGY